MAIVIPELKADAPVTIAFNRGYVYLTSTITALGGVLFGFDLVIISGTIPFFSSFFHLNEYQTGWAVGCINLGCVGGALLSGKLSDLIGRKRLLMLCALLFALTGIGTGWSQNFLSFVIFRMLSGVAVGAAALVCPIYTAEISPTPLRGRMVSFYQLAITAGILLAYLSNYFLLHTGVNNWRYMFTSQAIPAALFFTGLFFVAESPRWLVGKQRMTEAVDILTRIGGTPYAQWESGNIKKSFANLKKEQIKDVFGKDVIHIMVIGILIAVFSQAGGQNSLFSYAPEIFKNAGMDSNSAFLQSIIVGLINFVFTFVAILTIDKVGRKSLLMSGSVLLFFDAVAIASAFYFHLPGVWVLVFVLGFIAIYSATLGPVTWVALSEIFPNRIRSNGMAAATLSLWLANFITTASFPILKTHLGLPATFSIHAGICLLYFLFIKLRIPETKGKSLEEIELLLVKPNS